MTEEQQPLEIILLNLVKAYLSRRLAGKYSIEWKAAKESEDGRKEYDDKKNKLARDAFLAIRARTGADFIEYFVSTLCSVPQHMSDSTFTSLSTQLYQDTERVRTLTMLALSARS